MEKKFFTIDDVAWYLGYAPTYIRNLVRQNKIPYLKPNGKLLFSVEEIDNWVQSDGKIFPERMVVND